MTDEVQDSPTDATGVSDLGCLLGLETIATIIRKARTGTATSTELRRAEQLLHVIGHAIAERPS